MDKIDKRVSNRTGGVPFVAKVVTYRPPALLATGEMSICQNVRNAYPGIRKRRGLELYDSWTDIEDLFDECIFDGGEGEHYFPSTEIYGEGTTWNSAKSASPDLDRDVITNDPSKQVNIGAEFLDDGMNPSSYTIRRFLFVFFLCGIPEYGILPTNVIYSNASIIITPYEYLADLPGPLATPAMPRLCLVIADVTGQDITDEPRQAYNPTAWGDISMVLASDDIVDMNDIVSPDKIIFELNDAGLSHLNSNMGGRAEFALVEYDHDFKDVAPTINSWEDPIPVGSVVKSYGGCNSGNYDYPYLVGDGVDVNRNPISIYQYIKSGSLNDSGEFEKHTFLTLRNGEVYKIPQNPPDALTGTALDYQQFSAGAILESKPSWGSINDMLVYSDGYSQHQIWTGDRQKIKAAYVCPGTTPETEYDGEDIWEEVVDDIGGLVLQADVASTFAGSTGIMICTQTPASTFHFKIGSSVQVVPGVIASVYTYQQGVGWNLESVTSDTTLGPSSQSFGVDGSIAFVTSTGETPSEFFGISGYWYRIVPASSYFSGFKIRRIEYSNENFVSLENVWDGIPIDAIEAQVYYPTDGSVTEAYYSYATSLIDASLLPVDGYIYISILDQVEAFLFDVGVTPNTAADREIESVEFWDGATWTASTFDDTTVCFSKSGRVNITQQCEAQPYRFNGSQIATMWFRIRPAYAMSDTVSFGIQYVPRIRPVYKEFGSVGLCNSIWKDRACYVFERFPSDLYVSAGGAVNVLNGIDFAILSAGDGRKNEIVCMKKFHNELMVWQKEHGQEGGCLTLFEGYSPATFGKLVISSKVGGVNAAACVVVDGSAAQTTRRDDLVQTRSYWVSHYGIFMSDGRVCQRISDDIQNYFDQRNPECLRRGFEGECWAFYDSSDNVVRFGIVSGNSSQVCNVFPVYDITTGTWTFDSYEEENAPLCVTEADAASGDVPVLQIGGAPQKYYRMNTGLNDDGLGIVSDVQFEINSGGALMDLSELYLRMMVQDQGVCYFTALENGRLMSENSESIDMSALETNDTILRVRLIKDICQVNNISIGLSNDDVDKDLFLYDYFLDYAVLAER